MISDEQNDDRHGDSPSEAAAEPPGQAEARHDGGGNQASEPVRCRWLGLGTQEHACNEG